MIVWVQVQENLKSYFSSLDQVSVPSNGHHQHEEAQRLGGGKQKQSRIKIFFFPHTHIHSHTHTRKSAVLAAASSASLRSCCRIPLTARLSCSSSSLLHPTFYPCILILLWTFGWKETADVATSRCSTAPCLCTWQTRRTTPVPAHFAPD